MTINAPPRPSHRRPAALRPLSPEARDPQALIEEARRRASTRRKRYGAGAALIAAMGVLLFLGIGRGGAGTKGTSHAQMPRLVPQPADPLPGRLAIGDIHGTTVVDGDGSNRRVLGAPRSQVTFSPDGRELAYVRGDGWIVAHNLATGRTRAIVPIGVHAWAYPRWSPDGRSLAYAFGIIPGRTSIAVTNRDGSNRHVVATDASPSFHWSPGGKWIAYAGSAFTKLWLVRPDGGERYLAISGMSPTGGFGQSDFSWSSDGERIVFLARLPFGFGVVTQRIDGMDRRVIVTGRDVFEPQLSPDGRSIAFLRHNRLIVRQLASGAEAAIASRAWAEQWSPDGRWIAYIQGVDGSIEVVSRDGTARRQVAKVIKPESIVWGPSRTH